VATTGLGDRSPVIALSVQDNQILVDMITQGPNQPMCCGNLRVLKWFKLEGNQLSVASHKELGNLGPNGETPGALAPAPTALKPTPAPTASSNPNTGLTGITWKWLGSTTSHGEIKPGDPAQYTVYFTRAEALVQADCNSGSAAYMVEGTAIKFGPIATTLIACGAGTQDSEFLKELQSAATYALQGADLSFGLASGGGTMRFGQ
jgi:heat shock protein HslJ